MTELDSASSRTTLRIIRWLALPVALVAAWVGVILLRRRTQPEVPVLPVPSVPEPIVTSPVPVPVSVSIPSIAVPEVQPPKVQSPEPQSPIRWLLYFGAVLFFAGFLVILQILAPELSGIIFYLIVLAAVSYGIYRSPIRINKQINGVREALRYLRRLVQRHVDSVTLILFGIAIFCVISATTLLRDSLNFAPSFGQGLLTFAISCLAIGLVLVLKPNVVLAQRWRGRTEGVITQIRPAVMRRTVGAGIAALSGTFLLFLLAEINGNLLHSGLINNIHHIIQLMFLILGVVLLIVGLGGRIHWPTMTQREVTLLVVVLLVALVLRAVALDTAIPRYVDEANFVEAIPRLWTNPNTPILVPFGQVTAFTWIYPILQSGISNIVGSGLIGLRLISVVFGVLGVGALYFLVRTLFHDIKLALAAALILATFPAHLHFSRLGLNNIADPFWGTLALTFLMRGLQSHRRSDYVLAGAALGLTQYFYEGGRLLFPPLLVVAFVVSWLLTGHRKMDLVHAAYGLLVAILIAAPVYYTLSGSASFLAPRLNNQGFQTSLFGSIAGADIVVWLRERFLYPFMMYTSASDMSWFYGGFQPMVILPLVPIFLLGIAYAVWTIRTPGIIVSLLWLGITALGNSLLRDNLWVPRYVVAFPAVALFMAIGVYVSVLLLWPRFKLSPWRYVTALLISGVVATAQAAFYFGDQVPLFVLAMPIEDWSDAFFRMGNLPPGTHVHFIMEAPVWESNVESYLAYARLNLVVDSVEADQVTNEYLQKITADPSIQHAFFINSARTEILTLLNNYFTLAEPQLSNENILPQFKLSLYKAVLKGAN